MSFHYHYDRESFLAGLRAGRALWRPPTRLQGWTCDPEYMVYFSGTDLGYSLERHFYKELAGRAIGVYEIRNAGGYWHGPILISTDPNAVRYYYGSTHLTYDDTFQYLGLTWYANWEHHYKSPSSWGPGVLRTWDFVRDGGYAALFEAAHVRLL